MGNAGGGRLPRQLQAKLQVSGVLIDGSVGTCSIQNNSGIGKMPGLQACEGAVPGNLVLQHELEYQISIKLQLPFGDDTHETETDGYARLVVHRPSAVDRRSLLIDLSGIWRMGPLARIALGVNVEMAVEDERTASAFSRQANDDVVAAGNFADRVGRVGVKAQRGSVHRHQDRREADRSNVLAHPMNDGVLGFV